MRQVRTCRPGGFTLMEVMVAILMLAMFSPIVEELCQMNGRSIRDVNNRAAIMRETGFLTSRLASDFGRATSFLALEDGTLHMQIYMAPGTNTQNEIIYSCDTNACLWRADVETGQREMVAMCVGSFGVMQVDDYTVQLEIVMRRGSNQRSMTFMGSVP